MATRLYLPISGTPPLGSLAVNSNWELTNNLVRLPCFTTKQDTALTSYQYTWPAATTQQWVWRQWQSEPMSAGYSWTTSDTVSMVIGKCYETTTAGDTHLAYVIRVVSGDGSVIRGVIGLYHTTSTEFPLAASAATRIHNARVNGATTFSSQAGDRIIIEIGLHGVTPGLQSIQMRFGDPSGTSDFALTAALTTDLCPWVELSRDVTFGSQTINETSTLAVSNKTIVALSEVSDQDLTSLAVSNKTIEALSEVSEQELAALAVSNKTIDAISEVNDQDSTSLAISNKAIEIVESYVVDETLYGP